MSGRLFSRRNREAFEAAKRRGEALLIGFLVAGDPDENESLNIMADTVEAGIDIVELGVPSADPRLDGDVIRRGHQRARTNLRDGERLQAEFWKHVRRRLSVPVWVMGYRRELLESGGYREIAGQGAADALVLPDCTLEEQIALQEELGPLGVDVVRFVSSAMDDTAIRRVCRGATLVYAQSYAGATGDHFAVSEDLSALAGRVRKFLDGGVLVAGFGLRTPEKVGSAVRSGFDGAVVGSALVSRCENGEKDYLFRMVAEMKMETRIPPGKGMNR